MKCSNIRSDEQTGGMVEESGACDTDDGFLDLAIAQGQQQEDALKARKQFGGYFVVGENWIVRAEAEDTAEKVQDAIGGEVESG